MISPLLKSSKQIFFLEQIKELIFDEQLNMFDFNQLDAFLGILGSEFRRGAVSKEDLMVVNSAFSKEFLEGTLQGRALTKPCGYSGDYLLVDKIFTNHISTHSKYKIWDTYFQQHAAPKAMRNRKEYFKRLLLTKATKISNLKLLNVVSGSGREILELYNDLPVNTTLRTTCVELDDSAIDYSKKLNRNYLNKVTYIHDTIFRYCNDCARDVIWSAGLFDYLEDRAFILLLKRFKDWLKPGGEIVIGNFNEDHNPSRDFLEIFGDWFLIHRTEKELRDLGKKAGFSDDQVNVNSAEDNIILYLHLQIPEAK